VGSGGVPPYRLLVLPSGPTPLSSGVEVRKILDVPFPDSSTTLSFQLNYPANSQFVAVVSDNTAFGSGGTSVAAQVETSSDTSCFNATAEVSPAFVFSIDPANQIVQCVSTRIWWVNSTVQGTPNFLGVIPGGQSFAIPESNITDMESEGTGFSWDPSIRAGTTLILVGGDDRGNGSAGSTTNLISAGIQNDISCLSNASPSSTAGSPAGGTYATGVSSNGGTSTTGSSGGTNVGAIVGGVLGGVAVIFACAILLWVFRRRQKSQKRTKKLPTDIIDAEDDDDVPRAVGQNELPQNYQPEPFMVPLPSTAASEFDDEFSNSRPLSSGTRSSFYTRSDTPDLASTLGVGAGFANGGSSAGRKGGAPRPMRAVNIIQHHDAGPNTGEREEPVETIELPPAYTMVRSTGGGGSGGPSTSAGT